IWRSACGRAPVAAAPPAPGGPPDTSGLNGSGPLVERLAGLVQRLEGAEQRGELGMVAFGATPLLPQIVGADQRVRVYVDSHPDDTRLAILAAPLGRLKWVAEPAVFQANNPPALDGFATAYAPYHAHPTRALAGAATPAPAPTHLL